ncbi:MAG: bifunctional demethylmenaquinone methyltransferase/2-methoxy-6-polyprenyl-1,4-benzoquinol methylase UbiE [bacterium]
MPEEILTAEPPVDAPSRIESYKIFNRISARYDLLNHLLSAGQDIRWRKKAVLKLKEYPNQIVLDLACGTADLAIASLKYNRNVSIALGIDPAEKMLEIGQEKVQARGLESKLKLIGGDGMDLPLASNSLDAAMLAFGIRNVEDCDGCLSELHRVLKFGGRLVILEFSLPENRAFRTIYLLYFRYVLPRIGGLISGDRYAYRYLNRTVETFEYGEAFCEKMRQAGFEEVSMTPLQFGIATIYVGDKD